MLESSTLPENFARTGPTFATTIASKALSPSWVSDSQPGMQAFNTSGSLRASQTACLEAAIRWSPLNSIALFPP